MPKQTKGQSKRSSPKKKNQIKPKSETKVAANEPSKQENTKLPNVLNIAKVSWLVIWQNRKTFSLVVLFYGLAYLILVLGLSSPANVTSLKKEFSGVFHGNLSSFYSGLTVFTFLIGSTTSTATPAGSAYQVFIIIIASLSIIWALRQFYMQAKIRARDSYYRGLFPLAQFVLVLLFIALELIPLLVGLGLYSLLINGGIAVTVIEKLLSIILVLGLVGYSLYLVTCSIIALYIVTLPNMTPMRAIRSARGLVKNRRWSVFRKIIFLPVLLLIVTGIVMLPFIVVVPAAAAWIFFIITLIALVYIHSYLYTLYRGLINEKS